MHRPEHNVILELRGVTKRYGKGTAAAIALGGVDLRVIRGEFVSLMGPSGSGKTTVLNIAAGLDSPDEGSVWVSGIDLGTQADHALADLRLHKIGFVFQSFNLLPALTVFQNVALPLAFGGLSRSAVKARVAEVLDRVGVSGCEHRRPAELSGGEQQRVAIARAIATRPVLLLADEPTGNLDSHLGRRILDTLRMLNESESATILMVTHSVFAASYGDRTLEMRDGVITRDARPAERGEDSLERRTADE